MHIFVDRLDPELVAPIVEAVREERPIALEIAITGENAGAKRLVVPEDGGPAAELLARGETAILDTSEGHIFVSSFAPRPNMYVFGAVDHAAAVASIGRFLGYRVTVCDARAKFVTPERFPDVDDLVVEWPDRFLSQAPVDERTVICVLTHDHKFDIPVLKVALGTDAGYIGAMGAKRTNEDRAERLRAEGVTDEEIARIHAPIGLKIGSRTPEEVAVAIAAQIVQVMRTPKPAPEEVAAVKLENSFEVAAPPEKAWDLLMDVPRIVPCMPGAKLDEVVDENNWKATMQVKLGPISLTFATDVERKEADEANRRVVLGANARETRNRGRASATIESTLAPSGGGTKIDIVTDLSLSGTVAQYGRGMIEDISSQMVTSFAQCLEAQLGESTEEAEQAVAAQAKPISGFSLFFGSLWRRIRRIGRRSS